jgi:hypothetical protein
MFSCLIEENVMEEAKTFYLNFNVFASSIKLLANSYIEAFK